MKRTKRSLIMISMLVLASLACSLGGSQEPEVPQEAAPVEESIEELIQEAVPVEQEEIPVAVEIPTETPIPAPLPTATPLPTDTPLPTPTTIPFKPIGLWQGLSSLNSYRLTIRAVNNGPTAYDKSVITSQVESGSDGESSHTQYEIISSSAEYPEEDKNTTDQYQVNGRTCSFSSGDDEVEKGEVDPVAQEMTDAWFKMVDLLPMVSEAVFVGEEELNGVKTNHFSFTVPGMGVESGAEVVASGGEYWLAQDGQYIVKYSIVLETRNGPAGDPNTKVFHSEFFIEVKDINQEVVITMPAQCQ